MAEDTKNNNLDDPANTHSETFSEQIIPVEHKDTLSPNPETKTMEVQKHPHHVTHKKKWTEYLLEFFMLFLAVFLGFIAENLREDIAEHNRAKHYANSLYYDMIQDSMKLNEAVNICSQIAFKIDTLRNLCRGKEIKDVKGGAIYYYSRFAFRHWWFKSNDATIKQLKSSGSLRYFRNYDLEDAIGKYDQSLSWLETAILTDREILQQGTIYRYQLLDAYILDSVFSYTIARPFINDFIQRNQPLITYDKTKWSEYLNFTASRGAGLKRIISVAYMPALENARQVITLLKQEYQIGSF